MRIVADSSCDLYTLDHPDFKVVPLTVYTDERSFIDDQELDITEMLDYLEGYRGRSYTSCPSAGQYLEAYEGADEIFVVTITSALSGSYNSAVNAAGMYKETNPDVRISVIDSLSTGGEEILLLEKLTQLIREGRSFDDIDSAIRSYQLTTRLFFSFYSLHNLAQNGRVSKIVSSALSVMNIAITGTASAQGTIDVTGKVRGERKSLRTLFDEMKKAGFNGKKAIVSHAENQSAAKILKDMILAEYPQADIEIIAAKGLCSYYMERKGVVVSLETK